MRWLRIAIGLTVTLLTMLCMLPAQAAPGSGWAVLLDEQGDLTLSDIRSARYTNQFSPIDLDRLKAAEPGGALWLRFRLAPDRHEQILRIFAPDLSRLNLYVLDGDALVDQQISGNATPHTEPVVPSSDFMLPFHAATNRWTSTCDCPRAMNCAPTSPCNRQSWLRPIRTRR